MASRANPGRVTRSRANTPLPALPTRQSHAYGAAGKATLQGQVTQSRAAIDAAFTNIQKSAGTPAAKPTRRGRKPKTPSPAIEPDDEDGDEDGDEDEESAVDPEENVDPGPRPTPLQTGHSQISYEDDERPDTALQDSAAYTFQPPPPPPPPVRPLRDHRPKRPAAPAQVPNHEPGFLLLCWRTFRAWLPSPQLLLFVTLVCMIFLGIIFFFGTIAAWVPLPESIAPRRDEIFRGIRIIVGLPDVPPEATEYLWMEFKHKKLFKANLPPEGMEMPQYQWLINRQFLHRIEEVENSTARLETRIGLAEDTISEIQRILPNGLAMVEEGGELVIPATFWQALVQKMQSPDASPLWEHFLTSNEALIATMTQNIVKEQVNEYGNAHRLVSKSEFEEAMVKSQDHMEKHFAERLHAFQAHVLSEARRVAADAILPKVQLEALAYSNLLRNIDDRLKQTNYLSPGLGAVVDPHHTSETFGAPTILQRAGRWLFWATGFSGFGHPPMLPHPPVAALLSWEEGTQCWCAAPSADEKALAQLSVKMPHKIYPQSLVLEHVPSSGTRDIQAAPQNFEVWAEVGSVHEAKRLKQTLDQKVSYYHSFECGKPPNNEQKWVCVFSGEYDIHATNYVQDFPLHHDAQGIRLLTDRVVVRVTKNWGGDHTCLYRVRLTGSEEQPEEET